MDIFYPERKITLMDEATLEFTEIREGGCFIKFDPPLKVEIYKVTKQLHKEYAEVIFDFGLRVDIGYENWIASKVDGDWTDKTKKTIEFELFHSFYHFNQDPNYNTLNWALFGNLAHRVECEEVHGDGINQDEWEAWKYSKDFKKIYL
jgi:hypothetical protein